jgi:catechol 2,3-dioxygenase-like lactoylglutathione lyase family enzyme
MTVQLDHTIVPAHDKEASAAFLADVLGLPAPEPIGPFVAVALDHGLTIDFADADHGPGPGPGAPIRPQHFAFRVSEAQFDASFQRICDLALPYWADPYRTRPGEIAHRGRGRAFYFEDPSGHFLEVLTRPEAEHQEQEQEEEAA